MDGAWPRGSPTDLRLRDSWYECALGDYDTDLVRMIEKLERMRPGMTKRRPGDRFQHLYSETLDSLRVLLVELRKMKDMI